MVLRRWGEISCLPMSLFNCQKLWLPLVPLCSVTEAPLHFQPSWWTWRKWVNSNTQLSLQWYVGAIYFCHFCQLKNLDNFYCPKKCSSHSSEHFHWLRLLLVIGSLYLSLASVGYFMLGSCLEYNVFDSLSQGPIKIAAQSLFTIHLITAFPLILNSPNQYIEGALKIPKGKLFKLIFKTPFRDLGK